MTRERPIIAIDGPVGAGKSTTARALARALGYTYLNTGAMYRAVAIAARAAGISAEAPDVEARLAPVLGSIRIGFDGERLLLGGRDVTAQAAEPAIGVLASRLSALGTVRERMRAMQRAAGERGGVVMEGRDIGTVVFPGAEFKFYLDADVMERARRRYAELARQGAAISLEEVARQLRERDARDSSRELAPLRAAPDAVVIDSTGMTLGQVIEVLKTRIEAGINDRKGLKRT